MGSADFGEVVACGCRWPERKAAIYQAYERLSATLSIANFKQRAGSEANITAAKRIIAGESAGGYWHGLNGGGKSHLAQAVANSFLDAGVEVAYIYHDDIIDRILKQQVDEPDKLAAWLARLGDTKRLPVLIIDEIMPRMTVEQARYFQFEIIQPRVTSTLQAARDGRTLPVTLLISNQSPEELISEADRLAATNPNVSGSWARVTSRLSDKRTFDVVENTATDIRPAFPRGAKVRG